MNIISCNINFNFNKFVEFVCENQINNHSGLNTKCITNNDFFKENSLSFPIMFHPSNGSLYSEITYKLTLALKFFIENLNYRQ